jgi:hypothetical protein
MRFANAVDADECGSCESFQKIARREFAYFWRELARPVTFFDEASPENFLAREIGEFFRKWRARQGSNLRPPA